LKFFEFKKISIKNLILQFNIFSMMTFRPHKSLINSINFPTNFPPHNILTAPVYIQKIHWDPSIY
jgi:hypothetical protein